MRVALDTNVLVYAEGVNGSDRQGQALDLLGSLSRVQVLIPVQALGELFNVLVRKARKHRHEARAIVLSWRDTYLTIDTSADVMLGATDLAVDHRLAIWDAVILTAASRAGCRLLLSEDLQEGFTWSGLTVADPFASDRHPLLESLLA